MPNWVWGSGIPCRLCGLDAMATAKTWCSHLKEPRLRRVSAQECSEGRRSGEP
jgi:ribosomal protein L37E